MPDQSHVGRRYEARGQVVEAERAAEFARAVAGDADAFEPAAVPPTFASVYCLFPTLGQVLGDSEVGIDLARMLHGEQTFEWPAPVRPGDTVDAVAEIASVEQKRGLTFIGIDIAATNQDGDSVCRGRSTLIVRGDAG